MPLRPSPYSNLAWTGVSSLFRHHNKFPLSNPIHDETVHSATQRGLNGIWAHCASYYAEKIYYHVSLIAALTCGELHVAA